MNKQTLPPVQRSISKGGRFFPALCNVLGICILLAVILTALPLSVPRFMGYEIYGVISGSMAPEIPIGSVVYVEALEPEAAQTGDVIAFQSGDSVITHRVVENQIISGEIVTKGDANAGEDMNTVPYADLIGRVVYHVPVIGRFMMIYASNIGKIYVLVFAACGVMFNILASRLRAKRSERIRRQLEREMLGERKEGI